MPFTEQQYENAILELFQEMGYEYRYGPEVDRDYGEPLLVENVRSAMYQFNRDLPAEAIEAAFLKIQRIENGSLIQKNTQFHDMIQNGVEVNYYLAHEMKSAHVKLVDYDAPLHNEFIVANQWSFEERATRRFDIVLFLNGFPLVVMELKSPSREETSASSAFRQLRNYMEDVLSFFVYNAFSVISDQSTTKAGTITAHEDRFMEWKTVDGRLEDHGHANFEVFFRGMFDKVRLIEILRSFICIAHDGVSYTKILAAYHQFYAVRKAVESTIRATGHNERLRVAEAPARYGLPDAKNQPIGDGKAGVFWHTQGSGKSLSMVFYAKLLQINLGSPTILVVTDRNDLDGQLFGQFARCKDFLRQTPVQAESRDHLKTLLYGRKQNGIFFSTVQKFESSPEILSDRKDIIVIADEAHRSHYGLNEKVDPRTGQIKEGMARMIRNALPRATFIGFTGTPISQKDRSTLEVFGNYIDVYDMTQSVKDGATRPVFYESRVIKLKLNQEILDDIDREYDSMAELADDYTIEKSKRELSRMDTLLGAEETIHSLCEDIITHYEDSRQWEQTGKALVVAYSRSIALKMYEKMLEMRPAWSEKLAVVMTSGNDDPQEWKAIIGDKAHKKELEKQFKDDSSPLKIVIVVDMWLTGFDVPSLSTMYVYKPMAGHNLMQAIARVNRVFGDKVGGLVVDYVGIASALKKAMNDYTNRDRSNYGNPDISATLYTKFQETLSVCRDLFHGFDYSPFFGKNDLERARTISAGVNFILDPTAKPHQDLVSPLEGDEDRRSLFLRQSLILKQSGSLCRSLQSYKQRLEAAFFEAIRTLLIRISDQGEFSLKAINERINELLKQSIKSDGVINLFSEIKEAFSLFDAKFIEELAQLPEKNLAIELLRKLLAEQISVYQRTNAVRALKFSKMLNDAMSNYLKGLLTNEEVIKKLLETAHEILEGHKTAQKMNLTDEELAFYDALTKPEAVKDFFTNDQLIAITKQLTEALRNNKTIDWNLKESARAGMRRIIRRLLKKHKYPPENTANALEAIMNQCNMWSDYN